jgi:lysophospholipase L1-like esterase
LGFSVLNEGIGGNAILTDGGVFGPALLERLDADAIRHRRVTDVILLEGINDLALPQAHSYEVIRGLKQAVRRLHAVRSGARRRLNVLLGTITPSGAAVNLREFYASAKVEARRQRINRWIRTSSTPDGYVDFDRALRGPADRRRLLPKYDSGDGLHPSSAGYRRMANAIPIRLLDGTSCG